MLLCLLVGARSGCWDWVGDEVWFVVESAGPALQGVCCGVTAQNSCVQIAVPAHYNLLHRPISLVSVCLLRLPPILPLGRHKGEQVNSLLRNGKPSEALSLLAEDPRLAWVKDGESGGYPIHIAAWKVRLREQCCGGGTQGGFCVHV